MMRRLVLVLVLLALASAASAQGGSKFPIRLSTPGVEQPPDPPTDETLSITSPVESSIETTEASAHVECIFSAGIVAVEWANALTMDSGDAVVDLESGTCSISVPAENTLFLDTFTEASASTALPSHTPDAGKQWSALVVSSAAVGQARSSDYAQPSVADSAGSPILIYEAVPDSYPAGNNYDLQATLFSSFSLSSGSSVQLVFGITGTTTYCYLDINSAALSPDIYFGKTMAGSITILDSDNVAPAAG
jgi:hypothetical protein